MQWEPDFGEPWAWADRDKAYAKIASKRASKSAKSKTKTHKPPSVPRSPFDEMPDGWRDDPATLPPKTARIAFRHLTQNDNTRTFIPCLLPPGVVLPNMAPYFLRPRGDETDEAYLLGITSTMVFDWLARRYIELNANFFIVNNLPVPLRLKNDPTCEDIRTTAAKLAAIDERYTHWATANDVDTGALSTEQRNEAILRLEALVACRIGLSTQDIAVVFETFSTDPKKYDGKKARVIEIMETM